MLVIKISKLKQTKITFFCQKTSLRVKKKAKWEKNIHHIWKWTLAHIQNVQRKMDKRFYTKDREGDTCKQPGNLGKDALTSLSGMVATWCDAEPLFLSPMCIFAKRTRASWIFICTTFVPVDLYDWIEIKIVQTLI